MAREAARTVRSKSTRPDNPRARGAKHAATRPTRRAHERQDLLIAGAAYLATREFPRARTQSEIAALLGVRQPKVSLLLASAKHRGWFVEIRQAKYDVAKIGKHLHAEVLAHFERDEFVETLQRFRAKYRLGRHAPRLHVLRRPLRQFPADSSPGLPGATDLAIEAATKVAALVGSAHRIGICWGYHLGLVVSALAHIRPHLRHAPRIEVVPLAGEPFDSNLNRLSSTSLAQDLMTMLNGRSPAELLSLTLVPAVRPHVQSADFDDYLLQIPGYRSIFGGRSARAPGRINGLDAVLTGISNAGFPWGRKQRQMYPNEEEFRIIGEALGDIGGVLLLRPGLAVNERLRVLQKRWTGLQPAHLRELAMRAANARSARTPGVICIAAGADKADCCLEALRLGYVNHLIVDSELGERLVREITDEVQTVGRSGKGMAG